MKHFADATTIQRLAGEQRGVYSTADLRTALAEPHPTAFARRLRRLLGEGVLRRFIRGWYVTEDFDLATLSQRLAPQSYVSFGNILAESLLVGPRPDRQLMAAKVGRSRTYKGLDCEIVHLGIAEDLFFGYQVQDGIQRANAEKAVLDVFYFHLRGRRFNFDPYSDIDFTRLDQARVDRYLARYRNSRFVSFVSRVLGAETSVVAAPRQDAQRPQ